MTKKEKAKDRYLRKTYRWTFEMYSALLAEQGGVCGGCGKPPKTRDLNLDHFHFHIRAIRHTVPQATGAEWVATADVQGCTWHWAMTKKAATEAAREEALPLSVRGLLCAGRYAGCNRKLGRIDDPIWLDRLSAYLKNPPAKKILQRFRP